MSLLKKFLKLLPTLFGICLLSFFVIRFIPGDPVMLLLGERGNDPEVYIQMKKSRRAASGGPPRASRASRSRRRAASRRATTPSRRAGSSGLRRRERRPVLRQERGAVGADGPRGQEPREPLRVAPPRAPLRLDPVARTRRQEHRRDDGERVPGDPALVVLVLQRRAGFEDRPQRVALRQEVDRAERARGGVHRVAQRLVLGAGDLVAHRFGGGGRDGPRAVRAGVVGAPLALPLRAGAPDPARLRGRLRVVEEEPGDAVRVVDHVQATASASA